MAHTPDPYLECQRCKQPITAETRVWLELDVRTGKYRPAGSTSLPDEHSQGEFPFGPDCAKHPNKPYKGSHK
jgi:hypothetical protein